MITSNIHSIYNGLLGVVETIFGGLKNKKLLNTRYRKPENINKFSVVVQIRDNLMILLKITPEKLSQIVGIVRQTHFDRNL